MRGVAQGCTNIQYATNQSNCKGVTMADLKLAHIEHLVQHLIYQVKDVNNLIAKAWYDLELIRQTLRAISEACDEWVFEKELKR